MSTWYFSGSSFEGSKNSFEVRSTSACAFVICLVQNCSMIVLSSRIVVTWDSFNSVEMVCDLDALGVLPSDVVLDWALVFPATFVCVACWFPLNGSPILPVK